MHNLQLISHPAQLLRINDAARLLAVHRRTVYVMIAKQELEVIGHNKLTRITLRSIEAYIERNSRGNVNAAQA